MPDRAIVPLLPAVSLGFICGIIVSTLQLQNGPTIAIAVAGGALVVLAGLSSVLGVGGETGEKAIVAALRSACAIGLYLSIFLFIITFLREGSPLGALIWIPIGTAFGLIISRLRVRDRGELDGSRDERSEQPA
jgi:hypothetical protein